jgi:hypothetical protein
LASVRIVSGADSQPVDGPLDLVIEPLLSGFEPLLSGPDRFVERLYSAQWIHDLPPQQTSNLRVKAKTWWKLLFLPCYSP